MHEVWRRDMRDKVRQNAGSGASRVQDQGALLERSSNYLAVSSDQGGTGRATGVTQRQHMGIVAFSKDRPMQLDCTLRTLHLHCKDISQVPIRVIYTTSSYFYERGYQKLKEEFPSVDLVKEKAFKNDLLSFVSSWEHILFLVDDNIFVRDFRLGDVVKALADNPSAIGFSLRLGRNTTSSYMLGRSQSLPGFISAKNGYLSFDWTVSELDFGYPLEVSRSVYRVPDILPLLNGLDYKNPNTLEALLDANKTVLLRARPRLLCCETSVTFCNPANKVQDICPANRAGTDGNILPSASKIPSSRDIGLMGRGTRTSLPTHATRRSKSALSGRGRAVIPTAVRLGKTGPRIDRNPELQRTEPYQDLSGVDPKEYT